MSRRAEGKTRHARKIERVRADLTVDADHIAARQHQPPAHARSADRGIEIVERENIPRHAKARGQRNVERRHARRLEIEQRGHIRAAHRHG